MIFNQIMRIGEVELGDKTPYQVLVDNQTPYKRKTLLVMDVEFLDSEVKSKIYQVEYKDEEKYAYCRGIASGSALNFSPSARFKLSDLKTEEDLKNSLESHKNFLNLSDKLVKINDKIPQKKFKDSIVLRFFSWLQTDSTSIRKSIIEFYYNEYVKNNTSKENRPLELIFRINNKFSGDYEDFRKLYVLMSKGGGNSGRGLSYCYICGEKKAIVEDIFNIGFFTIDQPGFGLNFPTKKTQTTLLICGECDLKLRYGFTILETDLQFYAYRIGKGMKAVSVYHYLIPLVTDPVLLKQTLNKIRRTKQKFSERRKHDLEEKITRLSAQLQVADREQKKSLQNEIKKAENKKDILEEKQVKIEIAELFIELGSEAGISYMDLYFKITDPKQNPSVKEIVNLLHIKKDRVVKLSSVFSQIKRNYNIKTLELWHLKNLIDENHFPEYLRAIFGESKISKSLFLKSANNKLKRAFLAQIMEYENLYFSNRIKDFNVFYGLLDELNVFR